MKRLLLVLVAACGATNAAPGSAPGQTAARLPMKPGQFGPSLVALTGNGGDVSDGNGLSDVDTCASCHPDAAAQWNTSPHSFASFGNPIYRFDVELARDELGKHDSQMCGGCHDMPLMTDGLMAGSVPADDLRAHSGVTCRLCHGIQSVTKDGNASYVWSRAPIEAPDLKDPASIARHKEQVSVKKLGTELCVGCHRGFLSPDMDMPVHLSGLDEPGMWRNSAWTGNGMARVDKVDKKTCLDCHMDREPATKDEYGAKGGTIASHRFLGGHTWMAAMRGDDDHLARLQAKLKGVASIDVQAAPVGHAFDVVVRNLLVGHRFPGGVTDIQDTWIEVEVADATGTVLAESGLRHATDASDDDTHVLRALVVDGDGHVLERHEMPQMRTLIQSQTLAAREAQAIRYTLDDVPASAKLPLTVTARLRHRSRTLAMQDAVCKAAKTDAGRAFLDGAKGARQVHLDPCRAQPITLIAETRVVLGSPTTWEKAYEHGMALVSTVSERLEEAKAVLEQALSLAPEGDKRAHAMILVQLAQVASKQGRVEDALSLVAQARALLPEPGPPVLDAVAADALMRVWRWDEAVAPAVAAAKKAPQSSVAWMMAARCYGSVGDDKNALAAATTGLELAPRDQDLLRSQATALAALHRPEAHDALAAYDRFRSPDSAAELRIQCAGDSPRCAREREMVHTHHLHPVR